MSLIKMKVPSLSFIWLLAAMSEGAVCEELLGDFEDTELIFDGFESEEPAGELDASDIDWEEGEVGSEKTSVWDQWLYDPSRITIGHDYGYKFSDPKNVYQNRSSFRLEYEKYFLNHYYLILDTKSIGYWSKDHRESVEDSPDTRIDKAYLQASFGNTSIGMGVQTVAWGESQLSVITDEISPRDNREFANLNLEELRLGQKMLTVNQYSEFGKFGLIFVPDAKFNQSPAEGSPYYFLDGFTVNRAKKGDGSDRFEYGLRWGKTFSNVDISLMAADLLDNEYVLHLNTETGNLVQTEQRFRMYGMTFSYVSGKFLWKGEFGVKLDKSFNNSDFQIVKKDILDTYLGFEYTYDATTSISMDVLNQHVDGWSPDLQMDRNRQQLMFTFSKELFHENLNVNVIGIYTGPSSGNLAMVTSEYQWDDNFSTDVNLIYPFNNSEESDFWELRDQRQLSFGVKYQF